MYVSHMFKRFVNPMYLVRIALYAPTRTKDCALLCPSTVTMIPVYEHNYACTLRKRHTTSKSIIENVSLASRLPRVHQLY